MLALGRCMCILRIVRVVSSILFALLALVLPMAGMQHYVCTMDIAFSGALTDCPMNGDDCDGESHGLPDCMVAAELLPDAEPPNLTQIYFLKAEDVTYLRLSLADLRGIDTFFDRIGQHRIPPDSREWYLKQQRLLI